MDVQVVFLIELLFQPQRLGAGARVGEGGAGGFLHYVAQRAGEDELAPAGDERHLDGHRLATHRGVGQRGGHPHLVLLLRQLMAEAPGPEKIGKLRRAHARGDGLAFGVAPGDLAANRADFALQVAHASLAGIGGDDRLQRIRREVRFILRQAVFAALARHQVAFGDLQLFHFGVAGQADDFHAVLQRRRDGLQHVRGADEEHLGEVERNLQVVIAEGEVLRRVEHFQQRRRGVAAEIHAQLVHFVQHEDGIIRPRATDALDDTAGQRPDVGAPMAADFRLVAHRPQRDADELPLHSAGDGLSQRGFSHARRADETEDGPLHVRLQLAHRQVIENAVLHPLQVVVILIENRLRFQDVEAVLRTLFPGQLEDPFHVGAGDRIFRRRGIDGIQPIHLARGDLTRFLGERRRFQLLAQVLHFGAQTALHLAQLALDGLHLLAQHVFALRFFHLRLHRLLNTAADFQDFDLAVEQFGEAAQAGANLIELQQFLPLVQLQVQRGGDDIRQVAGIAHAIGEDQQIVRQIGRQIHHALKQRQHMAHGAFQLDIFGGHDFRDHFDARAVIRFFLDDFQQADALQSLHDEAHRAIRRAQHFGDAGGGADGIDIVGRRLLGVGADGEEANNLIAFQRVVDELHRARLAHRQRRDGTRKNHRVAHRQQRNLARDADLPFAGKIIAGEIGAAPIVHGRQLPEQAAPDFLHGLLISRSHHPTDRAVSHRQCRAVTHSIASCFSSTVIIIRRGFGCGIFGSTTCRKPS
ncbi:MAG: hypothetical protein BWY76_00743 [bacterium ADurb.Bin429]|nr:MAG: hypothetical protein BWY76_00743 [bacterium ADurb.Bin429]